MTTTPRTRIERSTLRLIEDDDESYQVQILYRADGMVIGYRLDADESGGFKFTPLELCDRENFANELLAELSGTA